MADDALALLSLYVEEVSGIAISDHKRYLLSARLHEVMKRRGCSDLLELYSRARSGAAALREQIVDAMATNETYWFRDEGPWRLLRRVFIPAWRDARGAGGSVRVWSAACSTGQEPYSLAMCAAEAAADRAESMPAIDIIATDISNRALRVARRGAYTDGEMRRGLADSARAKYFEQVDGQWRAAPELRRSVRFEQRSLLGGCSSLGMFDLILCRNVLIYFREDVRAAAIRRMARQLQPGGALVVGASESLKSISGIGLTASRHGDDFYYQRNED